MVLKMDPHKILNFEKENYRKFPFIKNLSKLEAHEISIESQRKIMMKYNECSQDLCVFIDKNAIYVEHFDANEIKECFDLKLLFNYIDIKYSEYVYINWYKFDDIDQMKFDDFCMFFDYIWYPSSDDIEIFDESLSWIILIHHTGDIKYITF